MSNLSDIYVDAIIAQFGAGARLEAGVVSKDELKRLLAVCQDLDLNLNYDLVSTLRARFPRAFEAADV